MGACSHSPIPIYALQSRNHFCPDFQRQKIQSRALKIYPRLLIITKMDLVSPLIFHHLRTEFLRQFVLKNIRNEKRYFFLKSFIIYYLHDFFFDGFKYKNFYDNP